MRHTRRLLAALAVTLSIVMLLPSTASARTAVRTYIGTTSQQGGYIDFEVFRNASGTLKLTLWEVVPILTCDDGTTISDRAYSYAFSPFRSLDGHRLKIVSTDNDAHYWLRGHVLPTTASGYLTFSVPMFASDGSTQVCRTGKISWTAKKIQR